MRRSSQPDWIRGLDSNRDAPDIPVKSDAPYRNYASDQGNAMSKKIMIVDDEVGMRMLIRMILERAGYDVLGAADASEALEVVGRIVPDLFIIDQMMPGMTGLELCTQLRQDPRVHSKPILMLSARSDVELITESRELGVSQYLVKPVLSEELVHHVNAWVREHPV